MNTIFEENFSAKLDENWGWIHEEPTAWKITERALHLRTLPGTLWADANNAHNFLLRPIELSVGLAIQVNVKNAPQTMGEQAGLIWYHDDDNYIKLVKESLEDVEWIVLAREEGGQPELIHKARISSEAAELRFVLLEGQVQGQFRASPDDDWQTVAECPLVKNTDPKVGIYTHGCPAEIERWVELRNFAIIQL